MLQCSFRRDNLGVEKPCKQGNTPFARSPSKNVDPGLTREPCEMQGHPPLCSGRSRRSVFSPSSACSVVIWNRTIYITAALVRITLMQHIHSRAFDTRVVAPLVSQLTCVRPVHNFVRFVELCPSANGTATPDFRVTDGNPGPPNIKKKKEASLNRLLVPPIRAH